jgi:hypothetical protein
MIAFYSAKRSAQLCFAAFDPGLHPLQGVDEEGLNIIQHLVDCDRNNGGNMISNVNIAYVSKHAMSRLHERGENITANIDANDAFTSIAVLGHLARESKKHNRGELCLRLGDILFVGSMKHAPKFTPDGHELDGSFYDVRTSLPVEWADQDILDQGAIAYQVVADWAAGVRSSADQIPFLPRRPDYALQAATRC